MVQPSLIIMGVRTIHSPGEYTAKSILRQASREMFACWNKRRQKSLSLEEDNGSQESYFGPDYQDKYDKCSRKECKKIEYMMLQQPTIVLPRKIDFWGLTIWTLWRSNSGSSPLLLKTIPFRSQR